ncbi:MAG: hypothetical protein CM15mP64_5020 [Candidatus Neomarinimicrobiota bacterium]|nr:MAG: hypothetical protein CM15mP64_5020 [Candidatus Neomarinimicrobiota bacterium]
MKRTIYAFSHPKHQNYHIQEYVFTNNGCFDADCNTSYEQTLEGFQVYLQYRYAISREGMVYDGNWLPQSAAWGHNTMNDVIGEHPNAPSINDQFYDDGEIMRALFSWQGYHQMRFENFGGPKCPGGPFRSSLCRVLFPSRYSPTVIGQYQSAQYNLVYYI